MGQGPGVLSTQDDVLFGSEGGVQGAYHVIRVAYDADVVSYESLLSYYRKQNVRRRWGWGQSITVYCQTKEQEETAQRLGFEKSVRFSQKEGQFTESAYCNLITSGDLNPQKSFEFLDGLTEGLKNSPFSNNNESWDHEKRRLQVLSHIPMGSKQAILLNVAVDSRSSFPSPASLDFLSPYQIEVVEFLRHAFIASEKSKEIAGLFDELLPPAQTLVERFSQQSIREQSVRFERFRLRTEPLLSREIGEDFGDMRSKQQFFEQIKHCCWTDLQGKHLLESTDDLAEAKAISLSQDVLNEIDPRCLSFLTSLTYLELSHTRVRDLTALSSLVSLETLILNGTDVYDLAPIRPLNS